MIIKTNRIYIFGIALILILTFLSPAVIQFFAGVSNTLYTVIVLSVIFSFIFLHTAITRKILYNKVLLTSIIFLFVILISGLINNTAILKTILYSFFALTPFSVTYFFNIFLSKSIKIQNITSNILKIIVLIQLPIVLIQKYGYEFLIKFNNSSQNISEVDFMFGSFSIKADHALGFFLVTYLLKIIFKLRSGELNKIPWFIVIYISITIIIIESNLTKIIVLLFFSYYITLWVYKKIKLGGVVVCALVFYALFNIIAQHSKTISNEIYHYKYLMTSLESLKAVENGYAKRPQILIHQFNNAPLKLFGNGPYDYYNILIGEFKNTIHFSQLIWTINDLGIIGLVVIVLLAFFLVKSLNLDKETNLILFLIVILYLLMTNMYYDISMMISLSFLNRKL